MSETDNQTAPADPPDNGGGTTKSALNLEPSDTQTQPADPPDNSGGTGG
ncbi:MAG TPA: hypothetical protein VGJ37_16420 [Pyrinomonadaceae bacterium]|jgi:hypothetical protein